jgi:predicted TIM-barrel fold metal-dependent hydrolase
MSAMSKLSRRLVVSLGAGAALAAATRHGWHRLARPAEASEPLSEEARALVARAWVGLEALRVLDAHVHVVGIGEGGTGCQVSARLQSAQHPVDYAKFQVYLQASGVSDVARADSQYLARLSALVRSQRPAGRVLLLAYDRTYGEDGEAREAQTEFYTPNDYVLGLASRSPELFAACASVHPYRRDAVEALEQAAAAGAVAVKWLPNAQLIDPSSARCDAFYDALARLRLPLITHAGEEKAVHAEESQRLGNPLHLRRALRRGVTVVVAHCASLGRNPDLDAPPPHPDVDSFDLFLRLMREPEWEGRLFGDLSAVTLVNRIPHPLLTILEDDALQRRLINGSDYPLPAINALLQTGPFERLGLIDAAQRRALNEVDRHNPLLFDFVLKRTVRWVSAGRSHRLGDDLFMVRPEVFPRLA